MNFGPSTPSAHVRGLDSIRFIAAMWVVWSHFGTLPFLQNIDRTHWLGNAVSALHGVIINGPAAVIVFFVISGFCIHLPYACGLEFKTTSFLARRFVRIGIPLFAVICLSPLVDLPFALFNRMAIWSLFSELIYYAFYPLLRIALKKITWPVIIGLGYLFGLVVIFSALPHASRAIANVTWGDYPSFGIVGNALLGLPCWLLGVRLADWRSNAPAFSLGPTSTIWKWRALVWALSTVALVLRFHSPIGYPWSLNLFAIVVYFWLKREIEYHAIVKPLRALEWGGKWSYSLYLVHPVAQVAFVGIAGSTDIGPKLNWFALMGFICISSYVFYLCFEKPSHGLAKALSSAMSNSRWRRA